jgi:acyl-CoA synthetase (NDP forming)
MKRADPGLRARLDRIFEARSVALVGVSANPRKLNGAPLPILKVSGFAGEIWPVNPKYAEIDGLRCYPDVAALPASPDVALVLAPAREVPDVLASLAARNCRSAVVVSSGFEEFDGGGALAERLREVCDRESMALIGPNCEGVWSVRSRVMLTFGSAAKRAEFSHAPIAILSQSGAIGGAIARHLQDSGTGCAYLVSVGNETAIGILDYLDYMIEREDVRVVLLFTEGLQDGSRLLALAERARARGIVLIALKSGNSPLGRAAVASHTGKVATDSAIYRGVFRQAGIIEVAGLVELIEAAELFASTPLPRASGEARGGVAVYSIPGGTRALTADLCEARGVPLAEFTEQTVSALQARLPVFGQARNPTDMTGQLLSDPDMFHETLDAVASDPRTEALIVQLANRGPADALTYQETIHKAAARAEVPAIISFLGDALPGRERRRFGDQGIACARDPNDAVRWLDWLYQARTAGRLPPCTPKPWPETLQRLSQTGPADPAEHAAQMRWLEAAGIVVAGWALLEAHRPAAAACSRVEGPWALKALAADALHKTELGLLELNLSTVDEVGRAAARLRARLGRDDAPLLLQQMVPSGVEVVVSAMRNPDFGTIIAIGAGGVLVELFQDLAYLALPCDAGQIRGAISRLRLARLLEGFRGSPPADLEALVSAVEAVAALAAASGFSEIELNPLIVRPRGQGAIAVDWILRP